MTQLKMEKNRIMLRGQKIKDIELIPHHMISTEETTETIKDADGNTVGINSRYTKISTVTLFPENVKEGVINAEKVGTTAKEASNKKRS